MSWIDLLNDRTLTVTTGEGSSFRPTWLNATKDIRYNNRIYNFPGVIGSVVDRRAKVGDKFVFELFFDGPDTIADAARFEIASRDQRPWRFVHPFYGDLIVQPLRMRFDNRIYNITKITVDAIEVAQAVQAIAPVNVIDTVIENKLTLDESAVVAYRSNVPVPEVDDSVDFADLITSFNTDVVGFVANNEDLAAFRDAASRASGLVSSLVTGSARLIRSVNTMLNFPATLAQGLQGRLNVLVEAFDGLNNRIFADDLADIRPSQKNFYLITGGNLISNMAFASIVDPDGGEDSTYSLSGDYASRADLIRMIELLIRYYNEYLENLDRLTTDRADDLDSFVPDFDYLFILSGIMKNTLRNLESSIFDSVQEREIFLVDPSDVVTLAHRLYGSASNENIEALVEVNSLSLNDVIEVDSGRFIKYYS